MIIMTYFCHECGSPLDEAANFCDNCGEKLAEDVKFCPACGKLLTDTGKIKPTDKLQDVGQSKQASQQGTVPPTIQTVVRRRDGDLAETLFSFNGRLNRQRYFCGCCVLAWCSV